MELELYFLVLVKKKLFFNKLGELIKRLAIFVFLFVIVGCGVKEQKEKTLDLDLDRIKERGKIVALTGFNAYSYFIYKGQPMGFEYELVKRLAKHLEVGLEIKVVKDVEKMFEMLENGEGDLIAFNLTVTKERSNRVAFTEHHHITRQVLVQRRPDNWLQIKKHLLDQELIRNPLDLIGKSVAVKKNSAYAARLKNLSEEIGGDIVINEVDPELSTEDLIKMVADGVYDYTVADENIARLSQATYRNLDVETYVSFPQKISWAVRKEANNLLAEINSWIISMRKKTDYYVIYNRYFKNQRDYTNRLRSKYFSLTGGDISQYDDSIKTYANKINWDWRLLASLIYQESQFKPNGNSWAGASGLMQLMPATAERYGVTDLHDPHQSLKAGASYLKWLDEYWLEMVPDSSERIKFVLASYNIGPGHILDARNLAEKYGANPEIWFENVEVYLLKKSKKKFYDDDVVKLGYAKGTETVKYVKEILFRYEQYKQFIT